MLLVLFEQIRTKFENKHIYTDSAYWYNDDACKWLRLTQVLFTKQSQEYHGEVYSASQDMTDWIVLMRTFCKINKCDRQHVDNWLRMFLIYAHRRRQIPSSQLLNVLSSESIRSSS